MASIILDQFHSYVMIICRHTTIDGETRRIVANKEIDRKRPIDYSDRHAAAKYGDVFEGDEYLEANDNDDDNYMEVEGSPVDEDEDEEYLE